MSTMMRVIIICGLLGYLNAEETSTFIPVNRGAARQMFGSGNLRQPATGAPDSGMTTPKSSFQETKDRGSNNVRHDKGRKPGRDGYNGNGYNRGSKYPDFYPRFPGPDYDEPFDVPSYRNGAPVNGIYTQGRPGGRGVDRSRPGIYDGVYGELPDRMRIHHGLSRGHGVNPAGVDSDRFDPDQKSLIHELDDESDLNPVYIPCTYDCDNDQFLCVSTCSCINFNHRCDGSADCENAEDEMECENVYESRRSNGTCSGEKKILCPESGICISEQWLCDGDDDCGDYSDESHCGDKKNCTADQYECRNGLCIPGSWRCDGENDCRDFSDEENCGGKRQCKEDEHTCPEGSCIPRKYVCDGDADCEDGSDELKCHGIREVVCDANHFECATPKCIRKEFRCDGTDDCGDASDEEGCFEFCNANQFKCINGTCISKAFVCNDHWDCKSGEDEAVCKTAPPKSCGPDEFTCTFGDCIPKIWVCDGAPDCTNAADEEGCLTTCDATEYLCKAPTPSNMSTNQHPHVTPYCIARKHLCDGLADCPLKEDEKDCPKRRNCTSTDKCTQHCVLTVTGEKTCSCDVGFTLAKDNATCQDIDECAFTREPVCSQVCHNTMGSFVCGCIIGYVLRPDLRTCKAVGGNPSLIFTNRVEIRKVSLEPSSASKYTPIVKGLHNAIAMDYHYDRGIIYWSDVSLDVIKKVYVNGSNPEDVIRWGLESPGGIAIDWIHNLLFWTDGGTRRVEVLTLDTRIRHVLISNDLDKPRAIAVHPHYGYVFWTDWGPSPKIERADMDGTSRLALITDSITWPNGLTIDYPTDRIFWTDAKHRVIMSAKLDGTDRKKILSKGLHHPFAITVFEDTIYWTDWHFKSISSANKETGHGFKTIRSGLHFPMDLHSYHKQRQPAYPNHCGNNNGRCSHMCLPNSAGYSCVCPVDLKLKRDGKNCADDNFLILARKRDLRLIPVDKPMRAFDTVIPVDHVQSAVALAWDSDDDMVYWTDVELDTISRAHLNGTNQTIVISHNLESPAGLALDWITKKLYWTDAGTNRIECSNLNGSMRTLLIYEGLDKPRDIVVDPIAGHMYWSDWGAKPKIEQASMDGSNRQVLISEKLIWPNGLAIDFEMKRLYWADGGMKSIEYIDLEGKGKPVRVHSDLPHPFGLVIYQNKVYWTDWDTKSIHRANKDTGSNSVVVRSEISGLMDVRMFHRNRTVVPNPCGKDNGKCSHLCLLTSKSIQPQRYSCVCPTGLILEPNSNKKQCRKIPNTFIIFAHRVDIRFISFDTDYRVDVALPINFLINATGVDVDRKTGQIYWTDPGADIISRASFDGKHIETIISSGIDTVDSLVVDSIGRKLYWTDAGLNSIEVSELDGSNRKVLIWSGLDNPRAIALHYKLGLMFWTGWGQNARIERANMDGQERMTVISEDLVWPNGLTVDVATNKLYWNDAKRKVIEFSDLDGTNRKVLVKSVQHPYGLALMNGFIYWSDWMTKAIHQANKTTGADAKILVDKLDGIMDVHTITPRDTDDVQDACIKKRCSHLCLRNPHGASCACPTGILGFGQTLDNCHEFPINSLFLTGQKGLARISLDTPEMRDITLPTDDRIVQPDSVDFYWNEHIIFFADESYRGNGNKVIRSGKMSKITDGFPVVTEKSDSYFLFAVDWISGNIYFTDQRRSTIEVIHRGGFNRMTLINDTEDTEHWFASIALFPKLGYIFWCRLGKNSNIQRAYLDGSNRRVIVSNNLADPNGLTIDYDNRKLYWADMRNNRIEMSDLNGNYRVQLIAAADNPYGLTLLGDYIYWIGHLGTSSSLKRADKATGSNRINIRTSMSVITNIRAVSASLQKGWNPCAEGNGGCTHYCFFVKKNYTCACPVGAENDFSCSVRPKKWVPIRKPGTENDPDYDHDEDERPVEVIPKTTYREKDDKFLNNKNVKNKTYTTMTITIVVVVTITIIIIAAIIYLVCQRKPKQEKYMYGKRRNVMTFSNPNYNASAADSVANSAGTEKKGIWKRLKYDSSQKVNSANVEYPVKLQHLPLHFIQMNETETT
ncbi:low-density lipoprotein receptor-related protein 4-like isoform X2 [Microplitis mediator]|uniref:low-density lipoprotein receptor-related protein 4-like isoform X2 n=1 Tax=Microplitis mediator TaxID=375433 RepID=UPI002557B43E|nr:low-density lipoprotein receptor-related protein 4-like isoform X2 [Microplitis mediator]